MFSVHLGPKTISGHFVVICDFNGRPNRGVAFLQDSHDISADEDALFLRARSPRYTPGEPSLLSQEPHVKPWPNGVASRPKFSTWVYLRLRLARPCDDLRSLWARSKLRASGRKFFTVWPPNPSQRKLSYVH